MSDDLAIRNTHARFCQYLDERRFEEWSRLFAVDGEFQGIRGRARILDEIRKGGLATRPELFREHITANLIIVLDGDRATVESDLVLLERWGEDPWIFRTGKYTDAMVRDGDEWLFVLWTGPSIRSAEMADARERHRTWLVTGAGRGLGPAFAQTDVDAVDVGAATVRARAGLEDLVRRFGDAVLTVAPDRTERARALAPVDLAMTHVDQSACSSPTPATASANGRGARRRGRRPLACPS